MAERPWADGPWELIETPSQTQDVKEHEAIYIANEMAFAHNAMLRGINSIYRQAAQVRSPTDIADFLFFVRAWAEWVAHHHVLEEERMFSGFEKVMGEPGFLDANAEQHHSFQPALQRLLSFGTDTNPGDYRAGTLRAIIDEMAPALRQHLSDEIPTLMSMKSYDGPALLRVYKECAREAAKQDKHVVPPMVLGMRDVTFQGGNTWPVLPPLSEYFVHYIFERKHAGSWRFLPCDTWGKPRPLAFGEKGE